MTPMKTIRTMLASVIFRQFGSCFELFDIAGYTQYTYNMYIVIKYQINLHSLRNRLDKLAKGSLFYLFLKLVQINFIFTDNVRILYIYMTVLCIGK